MLEQICMDYPVFSVHVKMCSSYLVYVVRRVGMTVHPESDHTGWPYFPLKSTIRGETKTPSQRNVFCNRKIH